MLNLLPPKVKKEQKIKQISNQITVAIIALLLMTGLTYSAIFFVNYSMNSQITKNNEQLGKTKAEIAKLQTIQDDVNNINSKIDKIDKLKSQRIEWSEFFKDFNEAIPTTVKINTLSIDKKEKINLTAVAETRADITKLQAKLEGLANLKEISNQSSTYDESNNYFTFPMTGVVATETTTK